MNLKKKAQEGIPFTLKLIIAIALILILTAIVIKAGEWMGAWDIPLF